MERDTVRRSVPILVSRSCLISRYERCLLTSFTHYTRPSPFISPFGLLSLRSCRTDRGDDEGVGRVVNRRCEYKKRTVNVIRPSESSVHITRGSLASLVCRSSLTPTRVSLGSFHSPSHITPVSSRDSTEGRGERQWRRRLSEMRRVKIGHRDGR